ncbi:MAG TPA: hypothetical protein GYA07_00390 [Verrucomicrobia bacterium]|nr:hypothetical protein [Verrucomicrobiota bacterium]HOP97796.1 hypothetical protein [Verrucomicrobiota bacterium]HPU56417.1 hypothetical protein [Verrucomicrobiota bacterium]
MADTSGQRAATLQPFTFGGAAAFGDARVGRLLLVQLAVALAAAAAIVWFVRAAWLPVVHDAIRALPDSGEIRHGRLHWPEAQPRLLARNRFLAIGVDLRHSGAIRSPSHVQVELGQGDIAFQSLLGYTSIAYPQSEWIVGVNRPALDPWWGAWRPPVLWITFVTVTVALPLIWATLAAVLAGPAWLLAFFADRRLTFLESWKVAGAAVLPGAVLMIAAIFGYGLGIIDLVQLLAALVLHLIVDVVYACAAPFFRPKAGSNSRRNPFAARNASAENGPNRAS